MAGPTYGSGFVDLQPRLASGFVGGLSAGLASKLGPVGTVAGGALVAGIAAAVAGGVAALNIGAVFDDATDTIRIGTGATGDDLERLRTEFKDVFRDVPTDTESAAQAVADLNTRLGLTGDNLEARSKQFLELSRITKTDLGQNIEAATRVFGDWGVEVGAQEGALDAMFRASQATGIGFDALGRQLVQYGAPLRQLGFGFETSAALIGQFEKEGVNAELVMGSLRIALGKMARDGEDAEDTFRRVTDEIANAGSTSEANAMALELFGSRAGPDMAAAIREGRFDVEELVNTVANGSDTILAAAADTNDWRQSLRILGNRVLVKLEPIARRVFEGMGNVIEAVTPHIETLLDWVDAAFRVVGSFFSGDGMSSGRLGSIVSSIGEIFARVAEVIKSIWDGLVAFWDDWGETILGVLSGIWEAVSGVIEGALDVIVGIFDVVLGILSGDWERVWEGIKGIFGGVWTAITSILEGAWETIKAIFTGALDNVSESVSTTFTNVLTWFSDLPGRIVSALGDLGRLLWDAGKSIVRGLWEGIKSMGSWLAEKIGGWVSEKIPGPIKSVLGIGSPSKVTAALGQNVVQGLSLGMSKDLRTVEAAALSMAAAAIPTLEPVRAQAIGSAVAGSAVRGFDDDHTRRSFTFGDIHLYGVKGDETEDSLARALSAAVTPYIEL